MIKEFIWDKGSHLYKVSKITFTFINHYVFNTLRTSDADLRLYAYKQFKYPVPNVLNRKWEDKRFWPEYELTFPMINVLVNLTMYVYLLSSFPYVWHMAHFQRTYKLQCINFVHQSRKWKYCFFWTCKEMFSYKPFLNWKTNILARKSYMSEIYGSQQGRQSTYNVTKRCFCVTTRGKAALHILSVFL
jgi:hypothetical protein